MKRTGRDLRSRMSFLIHAHFRFLERRCEVILAEVLHDSKRAMGGRDLTKARLIEVLKK